MNDLTLATDRSLQELDERYRALYRTQCDRLVPLLGSLDDAQWQAASRNRSWTVQQTMQHVAGVRKECVRNLAGEPPEWGRFDPHRTPQEDIDRRADETPSETVAGFAEATAALLTHLEADAESDHQRPMLWGEQADFRLFFVHVLWDSSVHERDMLAPLGIPHTPSDDEIRFTLAYGLLLASVTVRMAGRSLACDLSVDGVGRAALDVSETAIRVSIDSDVDERAALHAPDAPALIDALSGRGHVSSVLEGPSDEVESLGRFAAFLSHEPT